MVQCWHDRNINFARWLHPAMWLWDHDSEFTKWQFWVKPTLQRETWLWDDMSLNSPGGSTLQCDRRWLWDNMPVNSPKRLKYWNSTSGFDFGHITTVDMSFCTSLQNVIQIGPPSAEKMTSCRFSRWRISAILDFRGPIIILWRAHVRLHIGHQ